MPCSAVRDTLAMRVTERKQKSSGLAGLRQLRRQFALIRRKKMMQRDKSDHCKRNGQKRAHGAPDPGPERERQNNGERVEREAMAEHRRRDELALHRCE